MRAHYPLCELTTLSLTFSYQRDFPAGTQTSSTRPVARAPLPPASARAPPPATLASPGRLAAQPPRLSRGATLVYNPPTATSSRPARLLDSLLAPSGSGTPTRLTPTVGWSTDRDRVPRLLTLLAHSPGRTGQLSETARTHANPVEGIPIVVDPGPSVPVPVKVRYSSARPRHASRTRAPDSRKNSSHPE